jgi:hypothetical protein
VALVEGARFVEGAELGEFGLAEKEGLLPRLPWLVVCAATGRASNANDIEARQPMVARKQTARRGIARRGILELSDDDLVSAAYANCEVEQKAPRTMGRVFVQGIPVFGNDNLNETP